MNLVQLSYGVEKNVRSSYPLGARGYMMLLNELSRHYILINNVCGATYEVNFC